MSKEIKKDDELITMEVEIVDDDFDFSKVKEDSDILHITKTNWNYLEETAKIENKEVSDVITDILKRAVKFFKDPETKDEIEKILQK